jgi:glycosyltransferase involved in cell wall biosynthesis
LKHSPTFSRRKVAIIANSAWNIHNFRRNILQVLLDADCEVVVVTPIDSYLGHLSDFPRIRHIPLQHLHRKSTYLLHEWQLWRELMAILRSEKPDLVLNYTIKPNIWGGIAAARLGVPYICVVTGLGYSFLHNGWIHFLSKTLYRYAFRKADKVVFENIDDRLLFNSLGLTTAAQSVSVKGCGINIAHFQPQANPNTAADRPFVFSFIGRFLYDKGIREFVAAARILRQQQPNIECWLIGEIDHENPAALAQSELDTWLTEKIIIDKGATTDVRPYIAQSDCVVLPSYREAIPRTIQEAMSMARCAITTDVAGCREAVTDAENGYLVPCYDAEALAAAMLRLYALPADARRAMGENGRQKAVNEFDERLIAADFWRIIQGVWGV